MRSRHIKPTSITLGCMVEAIVSTGDTDGAFDLIHQIQDDEQCRSAINSVRLDLELRQVFAYIIYQVFWKSRDF